MRPREALLHPVGVVLLLTSLLIAALPKMIPTVASWPDLSALLVGCGLVAYLTTVVVVTRTRPGSPYAAVRQLIEIRQVMVDRLADMKTGAPGHRGNPALIPIVADAVQHLDEEILPRLEEIEARHRVLSRQMEKYRVGALPLPTESTMERLKAIHALQEQAINCCIQQAADAEAILLALAHEADDARTVRRAQAWADELRGLHQRLSEVLGSGDWASHPAWER